jgi:ABC-type uncharacterized transport system fused permease/ATPase subunit
MGKALLPGVSRRFGKTAELILVAGLAGKQARNQWIVERYYQIVTVWNRLEDAVRKLSSFGAGVL